MVDHGPDDTVFAFPVVALIEGFADIGSDPVAAADVAGGECPPRRDRQSKPDHRPGQSALVFHGLAGNARARPPDLDGGCPANIDGFIRYRNSVYRQFAKGLRTLVYLRRGQTFHRV